MLKEGNKSYVKNFWELDVYQRLHSLRKVIILKVVPRVPAHEKYDLGDQMKRASKATCAILSEGFAKRFQPKHWQKYITDSVGECQEMIDHLIVIRDIYTESMNIDSVKRLISEYDIAIRQLLALNKSWGKYHKNK
jgi:four helix bundle protein